MQAPHVPDKAAIALLPLFPRLGLDRIAWVSSDAQARAAQAQLLKAKAWGFDTESKPTFRVGEASDGPHILQLATAERAWVFQLHDPECRTVAAELLAQPGIVKAGFGLGDDRKRIVHKLDIHTLAEQDATQLEPNAIGHIELALQEPLLTLPYSQSRTLGALVLVDTASHKTSGAVMVL